MKLNEITIPQDIQLIINLINMLMDKDVTVLLHADMTEGGRIIGKVVAAKPSNFEKGKFDIVYNELLKSGRFDTARDLAIASVEELRKSTLKRQDDGSFVFNLHNSQVAS